MKIGPSLETEQKTEHLSSENALPSSLPENKAPEGAPDPPSAAGGDTYPTDKLKGTPVSDTQCAAHLKFLAALAELRESVSSKPGLFGIDGGEIDTELLADKEVQSRVREKKWQVYVSRAVERFTQWWKSIPTYGKQPTVMSLKRFKLDPLKLETTMGIPLTRDNLPPLDVLMVWHSFMLNPRIYLEDCFRQARMNLWATPFPLDLIAECIEEEEDGKKYVYRPGRNTSNWEAMTKRSWDNLNDPLDYTFRCPRCRKLLKAPWTTAKITMFSTHYEPWKGFQRAKGYADRAFIRRCPDCPQNITHNMLSMYKFHFDNMDLLKKQIPMPGTLYNANGVIKTEAGWTANWTQLSPNYYFLSLGEPVLKLIDQKVDDRRASIYEIRKFIEKDLYRSTRKVQVLDIKTSVLTRRMFGGTTGKGRGTLRRMMSRYWGGNSSLFGMDLVGAVIRQGTFVQKMRALNWLQLPNLSAFIHKCMQRYGVFWSIIVNNPSRMVVPTLDIDLVWHTHQLTPQAYYIHSITTTRARKPVRFIDHNDKIDEGPLSHSFAWTVKKYRKVTKGEMYSECLCWYCQATAGGKSLLHQASRSSLMRRKGESTSPTDGKPDREATHISVHNAVRAVGGETRRRRQILNKLVNKYKKKEARAMKRRADNKLGEPENTQASQDSNPLAVFQPDPPLHRDVYVNYPGCLTVSSKDEGTCIAYTCGASMASGSCGGSNFSAGCASETRHHGRGFEPVSSNGGAGGAGGVGCGGGGC